MGWFHILSPSMTGIAPLLAYIHTSSDNFDSEHLKGYDPEGHRARARYIVLKYVQAEPGRGVCGMRHAKNDFRLQKLAKTLKPLQHFTKQLFTQGTMLTTSCLVELFCFRSFPPSTATCLSSRHFLEKIRYNFLDGHQKRSRP